MVWLWPMTLPSIQVLAIASSHAQLLIMLPPWGSSTFLSTAHTSVSAPLPHQSGHLFPGRSLPGTTCSLDRHDLLTFSVNGHPVWDEWGKPPALRDSALNLPQKLLLTWMFGKSCWPRTLPRSCLPRLAIEPFGTLFSSGNSHRPFPCQLPKLKNEK